MVGKDKSFFIAEVVGKSGYEPIENRFMALIHSNCEAPFAWYKDLGLDKSDASRIKRGLMIPSRWLRIKIANHFKCDSTTIWQIDDLPYIRAVIKKQERKIRREKNE